MNTYGGLSGRSAQTCLGLSCHFVLSELQKQDPSAFGSKTCDQLIWMYTFILYSPAQAFFTTFRVKASGLAAVTWLAASPHSKKDLGPKLPASWRPCCVELACPSASVASLKVLQLPATDQTRTS